MKTMGLQNKTFCCRSGCIRRTGSTRILEFWVIQYDGRHIKPLNSKQEADKNLLLNHKKHNVKENNEHNIFIDL